MQLKAQKNKKITKQLKNATALLLSGVAPAAAHADGTKWSGSIGTLYYSETDRVTAVEPAISLTAEFSGERRWTNKLVLDSLTGASHNGAVSSRNPQTFTTPSGSGSYTIAPGQVALDTSFKDSRTALSSSWSQPFAQDYEFTAGFNGSKEYDFTSLSLNTSVSRYFDNKNSKFSLGVSGEFDSINPVGGAPVGLSVLSPTKPITGTTESKQVFDVLLAWTQVMNRNWIVQVNYNMGMSSGYMNDAYKFTSEVFDPLNGAAGDPTGTYFYDKRPEKRIKNAVFVDSKYHFGGAGILGTSYRYFFDDWGVKSHTLEANYRIPIGKWFLEPGVRYYIQSGADFYRYFHVQGTALPEFMTSDYRLGDMTATTFGLEIGKKLDSYGKEISFRAQLYTQTGESSPGEAYGFLVGQDLYPKVTAVIGQVIYKF